MKQFIWGHSNITLFLIIMLEEMGIPMPIPGDVMMILAGGRIEAHQASFLTILFIEEIAQLIGCSILYWVVRRAGQPLLYKYGKYVHLTPRVLNKGAGWLNKHGRPGITLGRLIPGFRIATVVSCGLFKIPFRSFLLWQGLGSLIYATVLTTTGYFLGDRALRWFHNHMPALSLHFLLALLILLGLSILMYYLYIRSKKDGENKLDLNKEKLTRSDPRAATMAGIFSAIQMILALNLLVYLFVECHYDDPGRAYHHLLGSFPFPNFPYLQGKWTAEGIYFGAIFFFLITGIGWAHIYTQLVEPRLKGPSWRKGAIFSILPTTFSLLIIIPLLGGGVGGWGMGEGLMPILGEIARNLIFCLAMATTYNFFRSAYPGLKEPERKGHGLIHFLFKRNNIPDRQKINAKL